MKEELKEIQYDDLNLSQCVQALEDKEVGGSKGSEQDEGKKDAEQVEDRKEGDKGKSAGEDGSGEEQKEGLACKHAHI